MTDEKTLELLLLLKEHRQWHEYDERWIIDYDDLVDFLLGVPPKPIELDPARTYHEIDVLVIDGIATLPDGRTVRSDANIVRVPILNDEATA